MSGKWRLKDREQERMLLTLLQEQADREMAGLDALVAAEPPHVFSPDFNARLAALIARTERRMRWLQRSRTSLQWAAGILVVLVAMSSLLLLGNEEIQAKVKDFFFQWNKTNNELEIDPEEGRGDPTSEKAQAWLAKEPEYVPEGYEEIERIENDHFRIVSYENIEGYRCEIQVYLYSDDAHYTYGFDNEHSTERIVRYGSYEFDFFESANLEDYPNYLFYEIEEELGYVILTGYLEWEELYKIFEGMVVE